MVAHRPSPGYQGLIALLSAFMLYTLLNSLSGFWKMQIPDWKLFAGAAAAAALGWLVWRFPWGALLLLVGAGVGAVAAARYDPVWEEYFRLLAREGQEFWAKLQMLQFETTFGPNLGILFLATIALVLGLLIVLEVLGEGRAFWSLAGGSLIFLTQWIWYYDPSYSYFLAYALTGFVLWVLGQASRRDAAWAAAGRRVGYRSHVASPITFVLIASLFAAILPYEFAPLDFGKVGQRLQERFPILKQLRGGGGDGFGNRFSLRSTGFSPTLGALGGPVSLNNTVALNLATKEPLRETAYLRGATFAVYTGSTWTNSEIQYIQVPKEGDLPSTYSNDVMRERISLKISPLANLGNSVFTLLEPTGVQGLKTGFKVDLDSNIWAEKAVPKGSTYEVGARVARYSAEQIRLLNTTGPGDGYLAYRQVPAAMPRRIGETARSIAAGEKHPFDQAVALEAYLRGLKYSLNVPATPPGRDFVDYFLFTLQEGYCVYSASAMAVMLRELGIPSRFVEGFAVPPSTESTQQSDGAYLYPVRNSQAHAWVEAYFPGYGWVTFDPTPRSDLPAIDRSLAAPAAAPVVPSGTTDTDQGDSGVRGPGDVPELEDPGETGAGSPQPARQFPWTLVSLLGLGAATATVYRRLQAQDQIRATEATLVVQEAWEKTDTLLSRFDLGRRPGQTASEYAERFGAQYPALRDSATAVASDYTWARYAPPERPLESGAPARAAELWVKVRQFLVQRFGWRRYLVHRLAWRRRSK